MQVFVLDTLIYLCFDIFHILFGKLVKRCYWGYFLTTATITSHSFAVFVWKNELVVSMHFQIA